jgi:hypothetical protein
MYVLRIALRVILQQRVQHVEEFAVAAATSICAFLARLLDPAAQSITRRPGIFLTKAMAPGSSMRSMRQRSATWKTAVAF